MAEEAPIELRKEDCLEPASIQPTPLPPEPCPPDPQPSLSSVLPLAAPILPPDPSASLLPQSILTNAPVQPPSNSTAPIHQSPPLPAPPEIPRLEETLVQPERPSNETLPPQTGEQAQVSLTPLLWLMMEKNNLCPDRVSSKQKHMYM